MSLRSAGGRASRAAVAAMLASMRRGARGRRVVRIALGLLAVAALVLVLAQIFLPGIAASRIRSRVARYGSVESVHVEAWPAIELLWGHADKVRVSARRLALTPAQTASLVAQASGAHELTASSQEVREGQLRLTDVQLLKHGSSLYGVAHLAAADVPAALPAGVSVSLLESGRGRVRVRVGGGLFGVHRSIDAVAGAQRGALVARPAAPQLATLRTTIFSDPRIDVQSIGASAAPGQPSGYLLTMSALLR